MIPLLFTALRIFEVLVVIRIVLSWTGGTNFHPVVAKICGGIDFILEPIRARLPTLGGLDLSPAVLLFAIYLLKLLLLSLH